jgi:S1-C subfamily serine protease
MPFFFGSLFFAVFFPATVLAEGGLSEEALADLVKPSVVRIAEHVTGTARIPAVKVDIRKIAKFLLSQTAIPKFRLMNICLGLVLSFIQDGYIATNAHVVSLETIKGRIGLGKAHSLLFLRMLCFS